MKQLLSVFVLCLFIVTSVTAFAADKVKIAVASEANTPASAVSPVAGRSPYYLIFDGKGAFVEALSNPHKNAGSGAGPMVVDFLAGKGVTTIIAGTFGNKMIAAMQAKGINHIEFKGIAAEAVKKALKK